MTDAPRSKATAPPMCKVCGHAHRLADPHVFGKDSQAKSTTGNGATERARQESSPTARRESKVGAAGGAGAPASLSGSSNGRTAVFDAANRGSNPRPEAKPRRASGGAKKKRASPARLELAEAVLADAEARTSQSKPKKRKSPMAKDGTNRGRPANVTKGKPPFDKKAHDREKARERRAAARAKAGKS